MRIYGICDTVNGGIGDSVVLLKETYFVITCHI